MRRAAPPRRGPSLLGTMGRTAVIAGTATATANAVNSAAAGKAQQQAAAQQAAANQQQAMADMQAQLAAQQQAMQNLQAPPPPAAVPAAESGAQPSMDDKIAQIQKLGELKAMGLLTDEEFSAKKAIILGL